MKARPTRRRWQFGLSTLLGAMLFCGGLAWLFTALVVEPYRQEQVIAVEIHRSGGHTRLEEHIGPTCLEWIGPYYCLRVVDVHLVGVAVDDSLLARMRSLPHLRTLWLVETATTPEAIHELQKHRPALEIHVVQAFRNQSTRSIER